MRKKLEQEHIQLVQMKNSLLNDFAGENDAIQDSEGFVKNNQDRQKRTLASFQSAPLFPVSTEMHYYFFFYELFTINLLLFSTLGMELSGLEMKVRKNDFVTEFTMTTSLKFF